MPYIPPSVVQEVKRMDLLTYLKNYEPYELVHFSGNTYTTRTHDSLKISNGKWMWWSQRTGGRSALDYLIKVRGYSFLEAVELLAERANIQPPLFVSENVPMEKQLLLPRKNQDNQKVIAYLSERGIDNEIIQFCLESGRVYESEFHHNTVFVGMDEKGNPKYAAIRGIGTSFIGEANGSDKNYSFSIFTEKPNDTVHLFESAIDCTCETAFEDMCRIKEMWHKTGGVQGFHLVQSFAAGEVTPELAHRIGLEFAGQLLQGRYQAVVSTHLNTGHIHNVRPDRAMRKAVEGTAP